MEKSNGIDVLQADDNQDPDKDGYDRQSVVLNGRNAFNKDLNADFNVLFSFTFC